MLVVDAFEGGKDVFDIVAGDAVAGGFSASLPGGQHSATAVGMHNDGPWPTNTWSRCVGVILGPCREGDKRVCRLRRGWCNERGLAILADGHPMPIAGDTRHDPMIQCVDEWESQ
jgi:hypothetical protein